MTRAATLPVVLLGCGVLLVTCSGTSSGPSTGAVVPAGATVRPATPAPTTPISVSESAYGRLVLRTTAGARCTVEVHVGPPQYGDVPPAAAAGIANASGVLTITYPAPHLPAGPGWHEVTCGTGSSSADFTIPSDGISARRFTARIRVANIGDRLPGVTARLDASLAPARDLDVAALKRTLISEWGLATRGLSTLDLLGDAPADIVITVVPARDTSVHVTAGDGSQGIFLYVSDLQRTLTSDNLVAVALHELGHIWCCRGPDSSSDGHWATPVADPLLQGVDRYGLMNHPVDCVLFGTIESCPNRFSDRDLRSMGFTQIPPPPRNACIDSKNAQLAQLATLKDRLAGARAGLDATDASLKTLSGQLVALETQYPGGMPPAVYQTYTALIDRYNGTLIVERTQVTAYNGLVTQSNVLVDQAKQLLC